MGCWVPVEAPTSLEKPSTARGGMEQQHFGVSQLADPTPLQGQRTGCEALDLHRACFKTQFC